MSKIRINDLARELEVKSKAILDVLQEVGVTEKKTHSSSLEDHEADKVRAHFRASGEGQSASRSTRSARPRPDEIKTKIDLSHISKPGDVLKALQQKQQEPTAPPRPVAVPRTRAPEPPKPAIQTPAAKAPVAVPPPPKPAAPPEPVAPPPRLVKPVEAPARPVYKVPEPPPPEPE